MPSIPFTTIAASGNIRTNTNAIEYDAANALQGTNSRPHKTLLMGIKLAAGLQTALTAQRVYSPAEGDANAGVGSMLAEMVRIGKLNNPIGEMWMIPIAELGGGVAGTKTLTITNTSPLAGTLHIYVAYEFYIPVAVAAGEAQNTTATNVAAAIQAHGQYARMPFTVAAGTNVVTFTMKWKGIDVADVRLNYNDGDVSPSGVAAVVATGVAGSGNPDISAIITAIAADKYDTIVCPFTDATNMTALKTELTRRWGGQVKQRGHAFIATTTNHGAAVTTGNAHNSPYLTFMPGNTSPSPAWMWAAATGCREASEPHPARPRHTLPLLGLGAPARAEVWTEAQRNTLLFEGASTYVVDESRSITIERLTTTYKVNAMSVDDWTFLDIETPRTLAALMEDLDTASSLRFPRHMLADDPSQGLDGLPQGLPIVTPKVFKGFVLERWDLWAGRGLVEGGTSKRNTFKTQMLVIRPDDSRTRLEVDLGPDLMNQFRGFSGKVSFVL